jgi:flagellin
MPIDVIKNATASSALHALQTHQSQLDTNLNRVATGRSVNTVRDNGQAYVLAQGLLDRASTLSQVGQQIGQGIGAVQAAQSGLDTIGSLVKGLKSIANQALASTDPAQQAKLQTQYNDLAKQVDAIAADASYNGVNLIKSGATSTVSVAGTTVSGKSADAASLGITPAANWQGNANAIRADLDKLDKATQSVRSQQADLGSNVTRLQTQAAYTQSQAAIAQQGAQKLTGANLAEASQSALGAANYQKLGQQALRNAVQSQDAVLSLFTGGR